VKTVPPPTSAQQAVIADLGRNFCVTSGAGCGKTRVLVDRYIRFLEEYPDLLLDQLVAITFTENAAAEMRDRIRDACRAKVAQARDAGDRRAMDRWLSRYWDVDVAPINTIHGFSASLLRSWPIEAGIDPNFGVLDDAGAALLAEEITGTTIERLLDADDEAIAAVLEHFQVAGLREILVEIVRQKREAFHRIAGAAFARSDDEILADLKKAVGERVQTACRNTLDRPDVADAVRAVRDLRGEASDKLEQTRSAVARQIEQFQKARTADAAARAAQEMTAIGLRGGSVKAWPSKEVLDAARGALKTLRDALRETYSRLPAFDAEVERQHLAVARALYKVASAAIAAYDLAKRERSALDFEDLQISARDLLRASPRVLSTLRKRFRAVLVDELQDTNLLQFEIVDLLASSPGRRGAPALRPGAVFGVGDPKQSIYRFRGAEFEVFYRALDRVGPKGRKTLRESWRLHPGLAAFANHVFPPLMGEMYEPIEGMARQVNEAVAELLLVVNPKDPKGFRSEEGHTEEARALAARLHEIVTKGEVRVWDRALGEARPARYGDIAMLLRRTSHLHAYEEALERQGVPYQIVAGGGFYKQQEVLDVIHLLRVLDDPSDDLHLAGVLRSPFFAVSDEGLYRLRKLGGTLLDAVVRADEADGLDAEDRRGLVRAARLLPQWVAAKDRSGLAALIDRVVFESGYAASAVGRFGGARAFANLRQMVELARHFQEQGPYGLGDYIDYVSDFLQSEMRQEQAPTEEAGSSAVRLMTIHKAKGLEFPIVVVPDLGFARGPRTDSYYIHPGAGLAVRMRQEDGSRQVSSALALARADDAEADRQESFRLLYVAATRAKDFLMFSSHLLYRSGPQATWLTVLLDRLGADPEQGSRAVAFPGGHVVQMNVLSPVSQTAQHGRRRTGPRDIFEGGRVAWSRLHARSETPAGRRALGQLAVCEPPPGASPLPRRLAATALDVYRRCPKLYWWTHVLGLEACEPAEPASPEGLSPRQWGLLAHRAMELARSGDDEHVRAAVEGALRELARAADKARTALRPRMADALRAFWHSPLGRRVARARTTYREMPFLLRLDGTEIAGTADLLLEDADGRWELVDYKSGRPEADRAAKAAEPYRLQLGLYALAASRRIGRAIDRWTVYFLGSAVTHEHSLAARDLEEAERDAKRAISDMAAGRFDAGNRQTCPTCRFRPVCGG